MDELTPWWTVAGIWEESDERYAGHYQALTAQVAEDMARRDGRDAGGTLKVASVFPGRLQSADWSYAKYSDPDRVDLVG